MIDDKDIKPFLVEFAARCRKLRKKLDLTQIELANTIGYTNSFISELETEKARPSYEFLIRLSDVFNVNLGWLLQGNGPIFLNKVEFKNMENLPKLNGIGKDIEKILWYLNSSPMFRHSIMGYALKFLIDNQEGIKKDIEIYKSELKGEDESGIHRQNF